MFELLLPLFEVLLIETPIYFEFSKKKNLFTFSLLILLNIISNLTFNLIYINNHYSLIILIVGEIIVFLLEGILLSLILKSKRFIVLSLIANGFSLGIGLLINYFIETYNLYLGNFVLAFAILALVYITIRYALLLIKLKVDKGKIRENN